MLRESSKPTPGPGGNSQRPVDVRLLIAWVVGSLLTTASAQSPSTLSDLLSRATQYVVSYEQAFSVLVSEEHYVQEVQRPTDPGTNLSRTNPGGGMRAGGPVKRQVLRSDYMLVQLGPGQGWMPFRDVFEVNGSKVRDRHGRLIKLFESNDASRFDRADRIMAESTRYNIGTVTRTINIPTLALMLLHPEVRERFSFEREGSQSIGGRTIERIGYRETTRPTLIRNARGSDLALQGQFWIQPSNGVVVKTSLTAADPAVRAVVTVTFRPDDVMSIWIPEEMQEYYKQAGSIDEIMATATYSVVRRLNVTTTEKIGKPPGDPRD